MDYLRFQAHVSRVPADATIKIIASAGRAAAAIDQEAGQLDFQTAFLERLAQGGGAQAGAQGRHALGSIR